MTSVFFSAPAAPVSPASAAPVQPSTTSAALLPPVSSGADLSDAISMLLALENRSRAVDAKFSQKHMVDAKELEKEAHKKELEAKRAEREAREAGSGGFFDSVKRLSKRYAKNLVSLRVENAVAPGLGGFVKDLMTDPVAARDLNRICSNPAMKWVTVAAAVGAIVATGGAGTPFVLAILGAALTSASVSEDQFHWMEKGFGVDEDKARWASVIMAVGGAACTGGAPLTASAERIAQRQESWSIALRGATTATNGAVAVGSGASQIAVAHFDKLADDAHADAVEANQRQARMRRVIEDLLVALKEDSESGRRQTGHVQKAVEINSATLLGTVAPVRG